MADMDAQIMRGLFGLPTEPNELSEVDGARENMLEDGQVPPIPEGWLAVPEQAPSAPSASALPFDSTIIQGLSQGLGVGAGRLARGIGDVVNDGVDAAVGVGEKVQEQRRSETAVDAVQGGGLAASAERLRRAHAAASAANNAAFAQAQAENAFTAEQLERAADLDRQEEVLRKELDDSARQSAAAFRQGLERDMEAATRSTDSTRFYKQGKVHQVAGFITAFMGAFQGKEMMQMVNGIVDKAVQRDIDDQLSAIAAAKQKVVNTKELRALDLRQEEIEQGQLSREFVVRKKELAAELGKRAATLADGAAKTNLMNASAAIEAGLAQDLNGLEAQEYQRKFQEAEADRRNALAEADQKLRVAAFQEQKRARKAAEDAKATPTPEVIGKEHVLDPETGEPIGKSIYGEKGATELSQTNAAYHLYRQGLQEYELALREAGKKYGGWGADRWKSEDVTRIENIRTKLVNAKAQMNNPGRAPTDADIEVARKELPGQDTWTTNKNPLTTVRGLARDADEKIRREFRRHGMRDYDPTKRFVTPDKVDDVSETNRSAQALLTGGASVKERDDSVKTYSKEWLKGYDNLVKAGDIEEGQAYLQDKAVQIESLIAEEAKKSAANRDHYSVVPALKAELERINTYIAKPDERFNELRTEAREKKTQTLWERRAQP